MGIFGHFGIENYVWRLGIVENLCEYCWFFLYGFLSPNSLNIPKIPTRIVEISNNSKPWDKCKTCFSNKTVMVIPIYC